MPSTDICRFCPNKLVASFERTSGACMPCLRDCVEEKGKLIISQQLREKSEQSLDEANAQWSLRIQLKIAEEDGAQACKRGSGSDQNPHEIDSDKWKMWMRGWSQEAIKVYSIKQASVIKWARESLSAIDELAKENGQLEISEKIETMIAKLNVTIGE